MIHSFFLFLSVLFLILFFWNIYGLNILQKWFFEWTSMVLPKFQIGKWATFYKGWTWERIHIRMLGLFSLKILLLQWTYTVEVNYVLLFVQILSFKKIKFNRVDAPTIFLYMILSEMAYSFFLFKNVTFHMHQQQRLAPTEACAPSTKELIFNIYILIYIYIKLMNPLHFIRHSSSVTFRVWVNLSISNKVLLQCTPVGV